MFWDPQGAPPTARLEHDVANSALIVAGAFVGAEPATRDLGGEIRPAIIYTYRIKRILGGHNAANYENGQEVDVTASYCDGSLWGNTPPDLTEKVMRQVFRKHTPMFDHDRVNILFLSERDGELWTGRAGPLAAEWWTVTPVQHVFDERYYQIDLDQDLFRYQHYANGKWEWAEMSLAELDAFIRR